MLRLLSDIHVDVNPPASVRMSALPTDLDSILVLAGDFGSPKKLADWLKIVATPFPHVVAVLGNHDYWGFSVERAPEKWRESLARHLPEDLMARFTLLERQSIDIGNIRFFGTTLWTDFAGGAPRAMQSARDIMRDYKKIRSHGGLRKFSPEHAFLVHRDSKAWLENAIAEPWEGKKVVITHHAVDYRIGAVRIVSNPFGYPGEDTGVQLDQVIALEEAVA